MVDGAGNVSIGVGNAGKSGAGSATEGTPPMEVLVVVVVTAAIAA